MSRPFDLFGGVDFSGAKEPLSNVWTAVGREVDGRLRILSLRPHAYRKDLAGFVTRGWKSELYGTGNRILWGLDFPFGLPAAACTALGAGTQWTAVVDWVADRPADEVRTAAGDSSRLLRFGDTKGALPPLDLRLYKQTVEGLRWIQLVLESDGTVAVHPQHVVDDADVTLIEVYPSGTSKELGLPPRRSPGRPGEARARAAALRTYLDFDAPDAEAAAANLEDAWDATIACLTAYLCRADLEQPFRAGGSDRVGEISAEGWIYRPPAAISDAPRVPGG